MTTMDIDQQVLLNRYLEERDKRLRSDGNDQYNEVSIDGPFSRFLDDPTKPEPLVRAPISTQVGTLIVGGGLAGVLNAAQLAKVGVTDVLQIEAAPAYGGTWYWNRFPGVRCDVEAAIYMPMLEETGVVPTEKYVTGKEIRDQISALADKLGATERTLFQTRVESAVWSEDDEQWIVTTDRGDRIAARFLILASGRAHRLKLPSVKGLERFQGHSFHTGRWDYAYTGGSADGGMDKLADKRVAIIGTGATAIQAIPHLAEDSGELFVVQRTPTAVDVRHNRPTDPEWAAALSPGWQDERARNFEEVMAGAPVADLIGDAWSSIWGVPDLSGDETPDEIMRKFTELDLAQMERIRRRVDELVDDPAVADALKPYYFRFCKRPTFHDSFLQVFNQPNVHLVDTDGKGVDEIVENGFVVQGKLYEVDCIVFATGQEWGNSPARTGEYDVIGRDGASLEEEWENGETMRSLHGIFAPGFPNLLVAGSVFHAASGSNVTFAYTAQAKHLAAVVKELIDTDVRVFEVSEEAHTAYGDLIKQKARPDNPGCTPGYYNQEGAGKSLFSYLFWGSTIEYNDMLDEWRAAGGVERDLQPLRAK